jgi:membrane fusion protein (multidrug efflux system)
MRPFHHPHPVTRAEGPRARLVLTLSALGLATLLVACGQSSTAPAGPPGAMPPAEVGVIKVSPGDVGLVTELPGRLLKPHAWPRYGRGPLGSCSSGCSTEGSEVKAGQVLVRALMPRPYKAVRQTARSAGLAKARGQPGAGQRPGPERYQTPGSPPMPSAKQDYRRTAEAAAIAGAGRRGGRARPQCSTARHQPELRQRERSRSPGASAARW